MWGEFRGLGHHGTVQILQLKPSQSNHLYNPSEKCDARYSLQLRISVWKIPSDIAKSSCTEKGITGGMQQYISIRVAL
jgi:hypothetical protein